MQACRELSGNTLIDAGKGGTSSGACTSSARTDPTASERLTLVLGRYSVSARTISCASGILIVLYDAEGVAGPGVAMSGLNALQNVQVQVAATSGDDLTCNASRDGNTDSQVPCQAHAVHAGVNGTHLIAC